MKDSTIMLILLLVLFYFINKKKKVIEKHDFFSCPYSKIPSSQRTKAQEAVFVKCAKCHEGKYSEENPCPEHNDYIQQRGLTEMEVNAGIKAKDLKKINSGKIDDSYKDIDPSKTEAPLQGYATESENNASETSSQGSTSQQSNSNNQVSGITQGGNQESTQTAYSASVTGTATTSPPTTATTHPLSGTCKILNDKLEGLTDTDEINKISQSWSNFKCN
jgi:hypothetical protein